MLEFAKQEGASAVEYAIMVAVIAVVVIVGASALGGATDDQFDCTAHTMGSLGTASATSVSC